MKTLTKNDFIQKWQKDFELLYDDGKLGIIVADYTDGLGQGRDIGLFWSNTKHDNDSIPYPTAGGNKNIAPIRISRKFTLAILKEIIADKFCLNPSRVKELIALYKNDLNINPEVENV